MPPPDAEPTDHPEGARATRTVTPALLREWPLPPPGEDKNSRGSVLVVGGAARTPGAAMLAGLAALRAGAGKLQMAVAEPAAVPLAIAVPEALVAPLPADRASGSVEAAAADVVRDLAARADVVCLGPGLDNAEQQDECQLAACRRNNRPCSEPAEHPHHTSLPDPPQHHPILAPTPIWGHIGVMTTPTCPHIGGKSTRKGVVGRGRRCGRRLLTRRTR